VLATHANWDFIGPTTLIPGTTTPARTAETVVIFVNGCGTTSVPFVPGSDMQSGNLVPLPIVKIGGVAANVRFAGAVEVGLYQFNVDIPAGLPAGDNSIVATVNGSSTQAGALITLLP
jgi:uncharacterized protein (TIGR03437 family)